MTSNLGVRTDVFHAIGGFDSSYLRGGDDVEFSWRLQLDGHSLGFVPEAVVHYRTPRSAVVGARKEYRYCQDEPRLYSQFRPAGMPPGRPLGAWGAVLARRGAHIARNPRDAWARGDLLITASRLGGLAVGSMRHRRWYLGRPV